MTSTQFYAQAEAFVGPGSPDGMSEAAADRYFARSAAGAMDCENSAAAHDEALACAARPVLPAGMLAAHAVPRTPLPRVHAGHAARPSGDGPLSTQIRYRPEILRAAAAHGVDPVILAAVAAQETGGPGAHSGRNVRGADGTGRGVFQIDSGTWSSWLAAHHDGMNVGENADKAAQILAENLRNTGGDLARALHRYNAGSDGAVCTRTTWGDGKSLSYEDSVLRHAAAIRKLQ